MRRLSLAALLVWLLLPSPASAQGQARPGRPGQVTEAELRRLANLPEAEQRKPANQARLQKWFFEQIVIYHDRIRASTAGRSSLVRVGPSANPPADLYLSTFSAPTGRGPYVVLWGNVPAPATDVDRRTITLPLSKLSLDAGSASTCWHESLHALIGSRSVSVRVEPYASKLENYDPDKNDYREAQDHVYIELLAEKTFGWLSMFDRFDAEAIEAFERQAELKDAGEAISYEVESFVWQRAHETSKLAWKSWGKSIVQLPQRVRDEFEPILQTRAPWIEEVVKLYVEGGLKVPAGRRRAGQAVKVPEWVLWPEKVVMPVRIVDKSRQGPEKKGEEWVASFDVSVQETRWAHPTPVTRGTLAVWLRTEEPGARLAVTLDGVPLKAVAEPGKSYRRFVADLSDPATKKKVAAGALLHVDVRMKEGVPRAAGAGPLVLPVHVLYKDTPPTAKSGPGSPGEKLYMDTEGVFLVKLGGNAPPPAAAAPTTPKGTAGTPGGAGPATVTVPKGGGWVLSARKIRKFGEEGLRNDLRTKLDVSDSGGKITVEYFDEATRRGVAGPPKVAGTLVFDFRWNVPPPLLVPGVPVSLVASATDAGSVNAPDSVIEVGHAASGDVAGPGAAPKYPATIKVRKVQELAGAGTLKQTWTPPRGSARGFLSLACIVNQRDQGVALQFNYSWVDVPGTVTLPPELRPSGSPPDGTGPGASPASPSVPSLPGPSNPAGPAGSAAGAGSIERQETAQPPVDKRLDDVPPEPGEIVPVFEGSAPPAEPPGGSPDRKPRWFTQAAGLFRFRLPDGFTVVEKKPTDKLDTVHRGEEGVSLYVSRWGGAAASPSELEKRLEELVVDRLSNAKGGSRQPYGLSQQPTILVTVPGRSVGFVWTLYFIRSGAIHTISLWGGLGYLGREIPPEAASILSSLEWLR